MKITRIEPTVVGTPTPGNGLLSDKCDVFIRAHTDEGIVGLGEDSTRIEYLTQIVTRQRPWHGGVVKATTHPLPPPFGLHHR